MLSAAGTPAQRQPRETQERLAELMMGAYVAVMREYAAEHEQRSSSGGGFTSGAQQQQQGALWERMCEGDIDRVRRLLQLPLVLLLVRAARACCCLCCRSCYCSR